MRISAYENVGSYSKNVDIEYDSSVETDRAEADKFVSRLVPPVMNPEDKPQEEIKQWVDVVEAAVSSIGDFLRQGSAGVRLERDTGGTTL